MKIRAIQSLLVAACLVTMPDQADASDSMKLQSGPLAVEVDAAFPRILRYEHQSGASFAGQQPAVSAIALNGEEEPCSVSSAKLSASACEYQMTFGAKQIIVTMRVSVGEDAVTMKVTGVQENGESRFRTLAFPGNALLSMNASEPDAEIAATTETVLNEYSKHGMAGLLHKEEHRETIEALSAVEPVADSGNYFFMADGKLAVGIAGNHHTDCMRTAYEVVITENGKVCRAWCPEWAYREIDSEILELPYTKILVTSDLNGDGKATWQDAAIAYRKNMPKPYGSESLKATVGSMVAMNFASGAQWPFLRILDGVKRFYLATDGIGTEVLIKGFSAEGHDSANTDYSGHYNERAGGLRDLNVLLERAGTYNTRMGVHINVSEIYPESRRFDPRTLMLKENGQWQNAWVWLDQSYYMDKRKDLLEGTLFESLDGMKRELPDLDFVYVDKVHHAGWESLKLIEKLNGYGWPVYVEGSAAFDPWAVWSHARKTKSRIMTFLWYSDREIFPSDSILRGGRSDHDGFMAWQSKHNLISSIRGTFSRTLPGKYLKHFDLLRWEPGKFAEFTGGVRVVKDGNNVVVKRHGDAVMHWEGDGARCRLFVPWDPIGEKKVYVYDEVGTPIRWRLPASWKQSSTVYQYRLTSQGRCDETELSVADGSVMFRPKKHVPYVIYRTKAPKQEPMNWGEGSLVKDPGFDSYGFKYWSPSRDGIRIADDRHGQPRLMIDGGADAEVSQVMSGMRPGGYYAAEVWVQVKGQRTAALEIHPQKKGSVPARAYVDRTAVTHYMACDPRNRTTYQRLVLRFQMPEGCSEARLSLKASEGPTSTAVEFDGIRVVEAKAPSPKAAAHWFYEDFECTALGGFGPFASCNKNAHRTHLAESNPPHTQDVINGRFSLKTRDRGRVARTLPCRLRFKPLTRYRFSLQTLGVAQGRVTVDSGGETVFTGQIEGGPNACSGEFSTLNDTESFMTLFKDRGDWLSVDDLVIDELGPVP